ncbi:MAG: SH3 domain-containing protein, partial [Thermoanaerobaculia bacterium]
MRKITILLTISLLFSCTNKPTPVTQAVSPADRPAIAILYVGLPQVYVHAEPSPNSVVSTAYQYAETVSVLSFRDDWAEVRTVSGSGWVERGQLLTAEAMQALVNSTEPRFLTPAATVPARA